MTTLSRDVSGQQVVPFIGAQNFRAIGGYPSTDGRRLRSGLLWRSAKLNELTKADVEVFHSLGIVAIADLRASREREMSPTAEAVMTGTKILAWDHGPAMERERSQKLLKQGGSEDDYIEGMCELYRTIAIDHATHLRELYQAIAAGDTPMLIHCAAGKDRTGIAVALLLDLLGIDRELIFADYVRTNELLDWRRLANDAAIGTGARREWLGRLDPLALRLVMQADPRYLESALDDMEARHGSTRSFAVEQLGMSEETIKRLNEVLLETPV